VVRRDHAAGTAAAQPAPAVLPVQPAQPAQPHAAAAHRRCTGYTGKPGPAGASFDSGSVRVMQVAALYDIHGNLPALDAVLAELEAIGVDEIVCGGDVVWGPFPAECVERLEAAGARFLHGNCERSVLAAESERDAWCREQLGDAQLKEIAAWPATVELAVDEIGRILFCHGSPRSDEELLTAATPEPAARDALSGVEADLVVCGHTHHQYDREIDGTRLVNAGSVGLPYEGEAAAFWALLGADVELRRTAYDVAVAVDRLVASGFPEAEDLVGSSLVEPISRDEVIAHWERVAGRGA
jgi:putative phosphoesterase